MTEFVSNKKILIACEESQAVCIEFRKRGFEAYSCDIQDCSGGYPEWHIKGDVFEIINQGWDMMIAFPPCTYLTVSGNGHIPGNPDRWQKQVDGLNFVYKLMNASINKICIENPIGVISTYIRKPDQIIQPYFFGDQARKTTCLWLKNLPLLIHNNTAGLFNEDVTHVDQGESFYCTDSKSGKIKRQPKWYADAFMKISDKKELAKVRSKTFSGIARAMAEQWGNYLLEQESKIA